MQAGSSESSSTMNTNPDSPAPAVHVPDSLLSLFSNLEEPETYRLLADLLADLAERRRSGANGRAGAEQLKELSRKLVATQKDKADLEFKLQTAMADLRDREERLGLELARIKDLDARVKEQHARLTTIETERANLESQLIARNTELHAAELDKESLTLQAQRSAAAAESRKELQALEQDNAQLRQQLTAARAETEQLRVEKGKRLNELEEELRKSKVAGSSSSEASLAPLWTRLATARLAPGGVPPTPQAGQRLADAFVDMATFVTDLDDALRRLLPKYTKRVKPLSMVWQGYAAGESFQQVIFKLLDPAGGASLSGILRMKLKVCAKWANATLIGSDAALEFIESELRNRLQEFNRGRGNRASVADFLAGSGHEEFQSRMAQLHSEKVAELFQSGA